MEEERLTLDGYTFIKNNNPQNVKRGGVGLYIKDSFPSANRPYLVTLPECIVYEIQLNKKKYFFAVIYRGPSQGPEEFDNFTTNFELMLSKMHAENPFCVIITGDFNCRSTQWWENDIENNEGRLTLFYKFVNSLSPEYTVDPIPPLHQSQYCLRNQDVTGRLNARTENFKSTFYPNCLSEWNKPEPELRLAPSIAVFKKKLLSIIRPPAKSVYGIHDPKGLSHLTQLRVGLSKLNFHKFKHNFRDSINPMCPTSDGIEDTEQFLLFCPSFDAQRQDLLAGMVELL